MAQDFAKQRPPQQASRKVGKPVRGGEPVSRLNWFISGFLFGVLCVVGGYLGLMQYQSRHPEALATTDKPATPNKQPTYDFGFYRELANAEVAVKTPPTSTPAATATTPAAAAAKPTTAPGASAVPEAEQNFLLQAGSFQDKLEADERRAKITLLNMPTEIVPGVVAGRTWYRVQVGPFLGRTAAEEARKQLSANNVDSIPLLMR